MGENCINVKTKFFLYATEYAVCTYLFFHEYVGMLEMVAIIKLTKCIHLKSI